MERYSINPTAKSLHKQGCRHIKGAFISNENQNLSELLASYPKPLKLCKVCLKNDLKAQELVQEHNQKLHKG